MYFKSMLQHALPKGIRKKIVTKLFNKYVAKSKADFADQLYLSVKDIKTLIENGMYVGSHGNTHQFLGTKDKSKQIEDIESSLEFLKKVGANTQDWVMCYPYGSYNQETLNILESKKCLIGLKSSSGMADLNRSKNLELMRFDCNSFPQ